VKLLPKIDENYLKSKHEEAKQVQAQYPANQEIFSAFSVNRPNNTKQLLITVLSTWGPGAQAGLTELDVFDLQGNQYNLS